MRALFENLQGGARVEDFLEWFPGVTRDQVEAVLKLTEQSLDVVAAFEKIVSSKVERVPSFAEQAQERWKRLTA